MNIDFSKLTFNQNTHLNPRDIFMSLPSKNKKYEYPRDVQSEVWNKWFEQRNEKNNIIKMNTGSGKTTIGLLVLQSCLNEGMGPAVYVVPDTYLVNQVCNEASNLGIAVVTDENDMNFRRNKAILVINIYKLINGKSIFGMRRNGRDVEIGSIIIDDAHACFSIIKKQYTLTIPYDNPSYSLIRDMFAESLKAQNSNKYFEVCNNDGQDLFMLVPFWEWQKRQNEVYQVINSNMAEDDSLLYTLPLLADSFEYCDCIIANKKIEISIKSLPISKITSFQHAKRRIFMSATLSDDSVLCSELGLYPEEVKNIISPDKANDIGDRLIIMPQVRNPLINDEQIKEKLVEYSQEHNVVVLVPSHKKAEYWMDVAKNTMTVDNMEEGISQLKAGHVGLVVLINKYDGVDLPEDACRILVIDGLPPMNTLYDFYEMNALPNSSRIKCQQIQKLEQGMGRGVRSNSDTCAIVLMGRELSDVIYGRNGLNYFSRATKEQISMSDQIIDQLGEHPSVESIMSICNYSLNKESGWISASKSVLSNLEYSTEPHFDSIQVALRKSFDYASKHQIDKAIDSINAEINNTSDDETKGLLLQYKAEVTNFKDSAEAQEIILKANQFNPMMLNPISGAVPSKYAKKISDQASSLLEYISDNALEPNSFIIRVDSILNDLNFVSTSYKRFEANIKELGLILGLFSTRPEEESGRGPDNLWGLNNQEYMVIECKNGTTTNLISKQDCSQLNSSINWLAESYPGYKNAYPVMIHNSNVFSFECSPNESIRIMTPECLDKFKSSVREFANSITTKFGFKDVMAITSSLKTHKLMGSMIFDNYTYAYKKQVK
ncbi:MAG: DEAD/DEAH box helicase family protein [Eubacterium sp.]|nr:DEAD/DEAH box helicase family protein [Eubacterium sp.]